MKTELNGVWQNQYGSEIKIEVDKSGRLFGKFRTAVGRSETKNDWEDTWFDLIGFVNGDLISFVVNFVSTGAIYSVIGRLISDPKSETSQRIDVLCDTTFNVPEQDSWKSVIASSEVFKRKSSALPC